MANPRLDESDLAASLAEDLVALCVSRSPGPQCGVPRVIDKIRQDISSEVADAFKARVADPAVKASVLAEIATRHGYPLSSPTIRRHRRRGLADGCRCAP